MDLRSGKAPASVNYDELGRIHKLPFQVVSGILFAAAMLAALARTAIRIHSRQPFQTDDFLLGFACVTLIASAVLLYVMLDTIYWDMNLILNPFSPATITAFLTPGFFDRIRWYQQMSFSFLTLTWTTIFAVKLSFLFFFRQMCDRLKHVMIFWRIVLVITILSYCYCAAGVFIGCPKFGLEALSCAQGSGFRTNQAIAASEMALDIATDILIILIPVTILWRVQIKLRQKIGIGAFLCLSVFMAVIAIVRISGLQIAGTNIDVQWMIFWQHIEATVAVIMVSLTAFRSIFGIKAQQNEVRKNRAWYSYRERLLRSPRKRSADTESYDKLPSIPGGTMTGMRSFVQRGYSDEGV